MVDLAMDASKKFTARHCGHRHPSSDQTPRAMLRLSNQHMHEHDLLMASVTSTIEFRRPRQDRACLLDSTPLF